MKTSSREGFLSDLNPSNIWHWGQTEHINYQSPITTDELIASRITEYTRPFIIGKPFVAEVPNAELLGPHAIAITSGNKVIPDLALFGKTKRGSFLGYKQTTPKRMDVVCSLIGHQNKNYFHWITEVLTLLEGIEYYYQITKRKPVLLVEKQVLSWQVDSLKAMGYKYEDCAQWDNSRACVKRLVVPSMRRYSEYEGTPYDSISPAACHWLRQRVLSNTSISGTNKYPKKIYISRRKATSRRIQNEHRVIEYLTSLGFVTYSTEDMNFFAQVRLFSEANVVVAAHGAGLTNIIFSPNLTVVELFSKDHVRPDYFQLSRALGFNYGCMVSTSQTDSNGNYAVDIKALNKLLNKMALLNE